MSRRLRAAFSIAVLWALVWVPVGLALAFFAAASPPRPSDLISRPVAVPQFLAVWTLWGAFSGATFALVLAVAERRRTIGSLSLSRTALWGGLGAAALPILLVAVDVVRTPAGLRGYGWTFPGLILVVSALLGACCAGATLLLARRGSVASGTG